MLIFDGITMRENKLILSSMYILKKGAKNLDSLQRNRSKT